MERTHVILPKKLRDAIDKRVGQRARSAFIAAAVEMYLKQKEQQEAIDAAYGSWKDEDHPELRNGVRAWRRKLWTGEA